MSQCLATTYRYTGMWVVLSAKHLPAGCAGDKPGAGASEAGQGSEASKQAEGSPFACVSAILAWDTFHMVHVLWIGLVDLPGKAPEKDWELQVTCCCAALTYTLLLGCPPSLLMSLV